MKKIITNLIVSAFGLLLPLAASAATYNGTTVAPNADGTTYNVTAAAGDTVTLTNVGGNGQVAVTFANAVSGTISIVPSSTKPASATSVAPGAVVTYDDVNLSGFSDTDISSVVWKFTVSNATLSSAGLAAANVRLYHYTGSWNAQPTQVLSADTTNTYFSATATGFSPFAVAGSTGLATTGSSLPLIAFIALAVLIVGTIAFRLNRSSR